MPDTLQNIPIPVNEWVDLYDLSSIPVGTLIQAQNIGTCDIYLSSQLAQPPADHDAFQILPRGFQAENESGSVGEWAFCGNSEGLVNIRRAL